MPAPAVPTFHRRTSERSHANDHSRDNVSHVHINPDAEEAIAELQRALSGRPLHDYPEVHVEFDEFLREKSAQLQDAGVSPAQLGVCFKELTTWGAGVGNAPVKTLRGAIWRTLSGREIYETIRGWLKSKPRLENGRPLIQDFSGVVRAGEILLVLGRPGSGCSTFLRTVANEHSSFLGVTGSLDYSGLTPEEITKKYRGEVSYIPEDDVHFPTLTVRQTLEFALESKTPKRHRHEIPRYLEMFARVFGISHVLNTLVGDEYIRGVSGGERKRISIIESLAANSSVVAWDNSTRGLDAASALDYARSLRIMTDTCGKATIVSLYQVSDAILDLTDKVLLIDAGRMIYQGPSKRAKDYFESLGYMCQERQTVADFLASVTSVSERRFRPGWETRAPKGAVELEKAFRASTYYRILQDSISIYDANLTVDSSHSSADSASGTDAESFKRAVQASKSRYVPQNSSYTISFPRQVYLCAKRQWWQLKGHPAPFFIKSVSTIINALLISSVFYNEPVSSEGAFARGGFMFYSAVLLGWIQLAEVEEAVQGRGIFNRQKRFAFVKPSAVSLARVFMDMWVVLVQVVLYSVIAYWLAGMQRLPGPFFTYMLFVYLITICMTGQFRLIGALSPHYEVAIRYCGIVMIAYIVFGGYLISTDNLLKNVPWFGWITYLLPLTYTYESLMSVEFHGLGLACSPGSIIPEGPTYNDVAFQSCAIIGSTPGSLTVSGDSYVAANYGYHFANVWRNFGIMVLFTIAFILLGAYFTEKIEWSEGGGGAIEYKQKSNRKSRRSFASKDEEAPSTSPYSQTPPAVSYEPKFDYTGTSVHLAVDQSTFTWRNLKYTVPYDGSEKVLLNEVSGYCAPAQMTALVGSSGAGKTTLLNTLAQRQRVGTLEGDMLLGGHALGSDFQKNIGFCEQMDIHDESSTIKEAFEFSALLRQSSQIPRAEKIVYVQRVLEMLDLVELQDAIIWSLPMEQKKRTTIGVELCAKPTGILFLDEPTSGLDGQGALNILNMLKRLSRAGQSILCTIHQATQQQFTLFDNVLALNPGGNTFYFGNIGASGETVFDYFGAHGVKVEEGKNVADFLIEVGVGVLKSNIDPELNFNEVWRSSPEAKEVENTIDSICTKKDSEFLANTSVSKSTSPEFAASTWEQTRLLTMRMSRQFWRTPEYPYSRLYASFAHALLNGFTFFLLGDSITDLQSRVFACFLILMLVPEFMNATSMRFIANRDIWESREHPSRIYGWFSFAVAQVISELPYALVGGVLFFVLFYFPVGLPLGLPAGYTFLMVLLFHLFATSYGQWVGALSKNANVAANLMPFLVIMCELFSGVVRPHDEMPVFWRYTMYYITPFTYWIGGIVSTVLAGRPVVCNEGDLNYFVPPPGQTCGQYAGAWLQTTTGYLVDPLASDRCGYCKYEVADEYLESLNLSAQKTWPYFGIFVGFVVSNVVLVLVFMKIYTWRYLGRRNGK